MRKRFENKIDSKTEIERQRLRKRDIEKESTK
jgi:hypothetical protein